MINKILIAGIALGLLIWNPYPLQVLELKTFDWLMSTKEPVWDQMIVLVDIDEEIVEAYGGYPLPRSLYSNIISRTEN